MQLPAHSTDKHMVTSPSECTEPVILLDRVSEREQLHGAQQANLQTQQNQHSITAWPLQGSLETDPWPWARHLRLMNWCCNWTLFVGNLFISVFKIKQQNCNSENLCSSAYGPRGAAFLSLGTKVLRFQSHLKICCWTCRGASLYRNKQFGFQLTSCIDWYP